MNRAERLFRLVELLRGRRLAVTASTLSQQLDVSPRTIYRDIAALIASGAPIDGEAGVGYRLDPAYHMPPLMFDAEEVQAIIAGLRLTRAFTDDDLAHAAGRAEEKLRAALDDEGLRRADRSPYDAPIYDFSLARRDLHLKIRRACEEVRKIRITYRDEKGEETTRVIHPFLLLRWQSVWTLIAWCELRTADRHFRLDRITKAEVLVDRFPEPRPDFREEMRRQLAAHDHNYR
ncbi:MAG: YafY family protein [Pseudomonadota bacterium]